MTQVPLIEKVSDATYFDDPLLTFEDGIMYGCYMDLTNSELNNFCKNKEWVYLMLYQNLFDMQMFAKFGNAIPENEKDWGTVNKLDAENLLNDASDSISGLCDFRSNAVVQVYYSKINTVEAPDYVIEKILFTTEKKK